MASVLRFAGALGLVFFLATPRQARATNGTWTNAAGGSWATTTNWVDQVVAGGGSYSTADFSTLNLTANATVTLDGVRTVGTLVFGDTTPSHDWTLSAGTSGSFALDYPGTVQVVNRTVTIPVAVSGSYGLRKTGAGTLVLSGANSYTGVSNYTIVDAGTLQLSYNNSGGGGATGTIRSTLTINSGATVITSVGNALGYSGTNWVRTINIVGGTLTNTASNYDQGWGVIYNLTGGSMASTATGSRFSAGGGTTVNVLASATTSTIAGEFRLRESNTNNRVTFNVAEGAAHPDLSVNGVILAAGQTNTGIRGIEKTGAGSMRITTACTYTGETVITQGTLWLTGSLANTTTTVAAAGILAGSGSLAGPVTVNGTLSPGDGGTATLTINNTLTLSSTATTVMQIGKSGSTLRSDLVTGISSLALGGTLNVQFDTGSDPLAVGDSFVLFTASGRSGSFSAVNLPVLAGGFLWDTSLLQSQGRITVGKANQTITFGPLATVTMGDAPFALTATASSGLNVTYASSNEAVATVAGNLVTLVGSGTALITASQAGNGNFNAAPAVSQTLTVNRAVRDPQTITFGPLPVLSNTSPPFTLTATASSGLPVSYTSSNAAVATVAGNQVTIKGAGTTLITARQPGNTDIEPAPDVPQTLVVHGQAQTITFPAIPPQSLGNLPLALTATASSGLAVSFTSSNPEVVLVSGTTATLVGPGWATLTASQAGNANFDPAPPVEQALRVNAAADLSLTPSPITLSVPSGESVSLPLDLANPTDGVADWRAVVADAAGATSSLEAVLAAVDSSGTALNGPLPSRYDFAEGESGTYMSTGVPSGNLAFYAQGNKLMTSSGGPLPYSNGVVSSSTLLGTGGRYFTRKLPGLFLFAADIEGPTWFEVAGRFAYGGAHAGSQFVLARGGSRWVGYIAKTTDYYRTINHLVLVDQTSAVRTLSATSTDEADRITGLTGRRRIYYFLLVNSTTSQQPDSVFQDLANRFLDLLPSPPGLLGVSPTSGTLPASSTTPLTVRANAVGVPEGTFEGRIAVETPGGTRLEEAPFTVAVGAPRLRIDQASVTHTTIVSGPAEVVAVPLRSNLPEEQPWTAEVLGAPAWVSVAASSGTTPSSPVLNFSPGSLVKGVYSAMLRIVSGPATFELPVTMVVDSRSPSRIQADPLRNRLYALNEGSFGGELIVLSEAAAPLAVRPIGGGPKTCAFSPDGRFLYTANFSSATISRIELDTLTVTHTIPVTLNKATSMVLFNIAVGRGDVVYYTDASAKPVIRAIDFPSGTVLGSYADTVGAGSLWFDNREQTLYFNEQNQYTTYQNLVVLDTQGGNLTLRAASPIAASGSSYQSNGLLASLNHDKILIVGTLFNLPDLSVAKNNLGDAMYSMSAYGHLAGSISSVYSLATGAKVLSASSAAPGDFAPSQAAVITYNGSSFVATSIPANQRPPSLAFTPVPAAGGSFPTNDPTLRWNGQPFVDGYRVYVGTSLETVEAAAPGSPEDRGVTMANSFTLSPAPAAGSEVFWRVDLIRGGSTVKGSTQMALAGPFRVSPTSFALRLPQGIVPQPLTINVLGSSGEPVAWTLTESLDWFVPDTTSGPAGTPITGTVTVTGLATGDFSGAITISAGTSSLDVPLTLSVYKASFARLLASPDSRYVLGLHTGSSTWPESQVLAIRAETGAIEKVVSVGTNSTDMTVDANSGRLYANNSQFPAIRVVDLGTFQPLPSLAASTDVSGLVADGRGRLIVLHGSPTRIAIHSAADGSELGSYTDSSLGYSRGDIDPSGRRFLCPHSGTPVGLADFDVSGNVPVLTGIHETPSANSVKFSRDGSTILQNYLVFDSQLNQRTYIKDSLLATDSHGRIVVATGKVAWADTGVTIGNLPTSAALAAISADDTHLVWINSNNAVHTINRARLDSFVKLPGIFPQPGATVAFGSDLTLTWPATDGVLVYRVYLGLTEAEVAAAGSGSPLLVGSPTETRWSPSAPLAYGNRYFWRADAETPGGTVRGLQGWFEIPLPMIGSPVSMPESSENESHALRVTEAGLAAGNGLGDSAAVLYRVSASDGTPTPGQTIWEPLATTSTGVAALGSHSLIVGDANFTTAGVASGGLHVYEFNRGFWRHTKTLTGLTSNGSGLGDEIAFDGDMFLAGMPGGAGRVQFCLEWPQPEVVQELRPSDTELYDKFGTAIAIQGNRALIGSSEASGVRKGRAYVFEFNPASCTWSQTTTLFPPSASSGAGYGGAVALDGDTAVLGTDDGSGSYPVHVFSRSASGNWTASAQIPAPDPSPLGSYGAFGNALALEGDILCIGTQTREVFGTPAGAVQIFHRTGTSWRAGVEILPPPGIKGFGANLAVRNGTLYVSTPEQLFCYRLRDNPNRLPRFSTDPVCQVVAGRAISVEVAASDPDGSAGLALAAEALPPGLSLQDLGDGRGRLSGSPTSAVGSTHTLRLRVTDPGGRQAWQTARVTVLAPGDVPNLTLVPASQEAGAGMDIVLKADASGPGPFTWQWLRDGQDLPGATSPKLFLHDLTMDQAGQYQVLVRNAVGQTISPAATLAVRAPGLDDGDWTGFGGDASHSGRRAAALAGHFFVPAWSASDPSGLGLHRAVITADRLFTIPKSSGSQNEAARCYDLATGAPIWTSPLPYHGVTSIPPSIHGGNLYFNLPRVDNNPSYLYCLDASNGNLRWRSTYTTQGQDLESPTVTDLGVFTAGGYMNGVHGFNFDGSLRYFHDWHFTPSESPAAWEDRLFAGGRFCEQSTSDGTPLWALPTYAGRVCLRGNSAVLQTSLTLQCIDLESRSIRWTATPGYGYILGDPAIDSTSAFTISGNSVRRYALSDGSLLQTYQTDAAMQYSGALYGQPVVFLDRLVVSNGLKTWIFRLSDARLMQTLDVGGYVSHSRGYLSVAGSAGNLRVFRATKYPELVVEGPDGLRLESRGIVDCGAPLVTQSSSRNLTIRNPGPGTLSNLAVAFAPGSANAFTLAGLPPATLAPGASAVVTVHFTPAAAGNQGAVLRITADDASETPFDVDLTGRGNRPPTFSGYAATTKAGQLLELPLAKILARAGDPDGDTVGLTGAASPSAQGGVVELGAKLAYMPPEGFAGTDTIGVTLSDAFGAAATGTLTITVTGQAAANGTLGHNLSQITPRDGQIDLVFRGIPGRRYTIQRTADMAAWEDLATVTAGPDGRIHFTDPDPLQPQGFYRTRSATP